MNKQIVENFINNNPKFEIPCGNPEYNHIQIFDSNLVFLRMTLLHMNVKNVILWWILTLLNL